MATVRNKFTGDAKQLERELERIRRQMVKLEESNQKLATESKRRHKSANTAFAQIGKTARSQIASLKQLATSYLGVRTAIDLVVAGIRERKRLEDEAKGKSINVAGAQAKVIKNIGDASDNEIRDFFQQVSGVRDATGFKSQAQLLNASASILSATGGDQRKTVEILSEIAPFFRDAPDEIAQFGGALADLMKNSGLDDAKGATAFALAIQGQARFENLGGFKSVAPALAATNIATDGDVFEGARRGAALFAAFGSQAGDVDATLTKGAVTAFVAGLERAAPHLETFDERLDFVRNSQNQGPTLNGDALGGSAIIDEVLKKGFRGPMLLLAREMLTETTSNMGIAYDDALQKIVASEASVDRKRSQLGGLTSELRLSAQQDRFEGSLEDFDIGSVGGRRSLIRQVLTDSLVRTNFGGLSQVDNFLKERRFEFGGSDADSAIGILQDRIDQFAGDSSVAGDDRKQFTAFLREAIDQLREIKDNSKPRPSLSRNEEND